jgi:predicted ATPase
MLSKLRVQHYKSLFDTEVDLEPLTVFIGPNGSGKSNICEALFVLSNFLQKILLQNIVVDTKAHNLIPFLSESLSAISQSSQDIKSKFWHGNLDYLRFVAEAIPKQNNPSSPAEKLDMSVYYAQGEAFISFRENIIKGIKYTLRLKEFLLANQYIDSAFANALEKVSIYDFTPINLSSGNPSSGGMKRTGEGIAYALVDILHANRVNFDELEDRFIRLVPNIQRISLPRKESQTFTLELVDRYSEHHIPVSDISDGTLRILAFLTALYQEETPSIICFEELENGVHPWLLHKMMELLKIVSTEGINGKPVQILITTHSPLLLDYVEPHQVRAVELDHEGKTQVHALPTDSVRFQKALEAYDGALSELWFTNVFGGNPV